MARPATEVEIPAAVEGEVVRDMYGEDDPETKTHRDMQLNNNPNVLFIVNEHLLLFRPTANIFWIQLLQEEYQDITSQWTFKCTNLPDLALHHTMNLSGNRKALQRFCNNFRNNLQRANNYKNEIEELQQRIQDLQLVNTQLQQQRDENLQRPPDE
nr:uncharacterized protein LOC100001846 isoform X3 [Danio rerio]|eukprot:XP_009291645.1 uncharacterized protein LOC100001846 isoform X3 [Danio rerio]